MSSSSLLAAVLSLGTAAAAAPVTATPAATVATPVAAPPKAPAPAPKAPVVAEPPSPGLRIPGGEKPLEYTILFSIDPTATDLTGKETIRVHLDAAQKVLWLHGKGLDVTSARVGGVSARWHQADDDGMASLSLESAVGPGDVDVELAWKAKLGDALEGVYRVQSEGTWYVFTQFEAISARQSFPCFDEPGFKTPFSLAFEIPEGDIVVANTRQARSQEIGGQRVRVEFTKTQPLPVYLAAFAIGPLEIVDGKTLPPSAVRKDPLPIRGVATKGHGAQLARSLDTAAKALVQLEKWFGIGYPFGKMDIVAVPDFGAGAMENAGLVTFRDSLLFVDDKSPIGLQKANAFVIAHEFAHQWFGDFVTLAWWDDVWLNEAFASFMEAPIVDAMRPDFRAITEQRADLDRVTGADSLVSSRQIRQPVLTTGDILNGFDGITYSKGQSVIEMFAAYMGRTKFQNGVREYMKTHAFGTATAADLLAALSKAAGSDVSTPFSTFLDQPGVPYVSAKLVCDAKKTSSHVELAQVRFLPVGSTGDRNKLWQIPVCVRTNASKTPQCTLLTSQTGTLPLKGCPKWIHPNADGIGYYRWSLPPEQLLPVSTSLKSLSDGERISFSNAVRAGYDAGTLLFADALGAAAPLAADEEPNIAGAPLGFLRAARESLVDKEAQSLVRAKTAQLYRPVLDKLKLEPKKNEDPRVRERRGLGLDALVEGAEDAATIDALAPRGRAVLDLDKAKEARKVDVTRVPPDLIDAAIESVVLKDASTWDDVAAALAVENDSTTRRYLLDGLTSAHDADHVAKTLALTLDPRLKVNEVLRPLYAFASDSRTRDAAWSFFQANYDAVVARIPAEFGADAVAGIFGGFCTEDKAKEVDAFFTPKKAKTPGMERALAITLEHIRLCAAKKAVHEDSAKKLFPKPAG